MVLVLDYMLFLFGLWCCMLCSEFFIFVVIVFVLVLVDRNPISLYIATSILDVVLV